MLAVINLLVACVFIGQVIIIYSGRGCKMLGVLDFLMVCAFIGVVIMIFTEFFKELQDV